MAKYTYDYSCGHGSETVQLFGPTKDRDSKLVWMSENKVCPDCYKLKLREQDAAAAKQLKLTLVCAVATVTFQLEAHGQIEANKEALKALGYQWRDAQSGLLGMLSMSRPKRVLCLQQRVTSIDQGTAWIVAQAAAVADLGYQLTDGLTPIDIDTMRKVFAAEAQQAEAASAKATAAAEVQLTDPKPTTSLLRKRIADLEKSTNAKWNGKLYGKPGSYNFYVANEKHPATDAEVAEREAINKNLADWKLRHLELS